MESKLIIGVSRCLLGDIVRYDGVSKASSTVIKKLGAQFELYAVCPEVEAGLSVPRPPVQLTGNIEQPRMTGRDDPALDITELLMARSKQIADKLSTIRGYVFKSRSPSCGLHSTPVYINNQPATETSRGLFARAICDRYRELPVIEEIELDNPAKYQDFLSAVFRYNTRKLKTTGSNISS